jgi:hypothetical protein
MAFGAVVVSKQASDPSGSMHRDSAVPQPHRQGGLWNSLTWSFFLSQVVAAESFIGSRAHAEGDIDAFRGTDGSSAQAATGAGQPLLAAHVGRSDDASAPAGTTSAELQSGHGLGHDGASAHQGFPGAPISLGTHAAAAAAADALEPGVEGQSALQPAHLEMAADNSPAAILDLATLPALGVAADSIDGIVSPILGALDNTIGPLDAILDHALATGTSLFSPIFDVADTVLQPVATTVGEVAAPVIGVADAVLQPIAGPVDQVVAPLGGLLDHALSSTTTSLIGPVAGAAGSALQPAADICDHVAAPITDLLSIQGTVASAGSIVISEVPVGTALPLDDLFSKGAYTDYNLALNSEPIGVSASLQTGGAGTLLVGSLQAGDTAHDDHDGTMAQHSLPTSALEELHLRGIGDGVGLV